MPERAPRVLLGVSGGIAAYKAPELVRAFVKAGIEVQVVMTPAARAFTTEMSLSTVSKRPVRVQLLDASEEGGTVAHILKRKPHKVINIERLNRILSQEE